MAAIALLWGLVLGASALRGHNSGVLQNGLGGNTKQVRKAVSDSREYKTFKLDNGLPVILIKDDESAKSSASMDVHAGSFWDPEDTAGVAHFLEHMLFLGSSKYPKEGMFDKVLAEAGGYSNAYTSADNTNYFFAVSNSKLPNCLDMFAQMFVSPLLSKEATNREVHAINAEHQKNLHSDGWRIDQVKQNLAIEGHPYHHFGTGNNITLMKDVEKSHKALVQLYHGHYCVQNMHLTVLSSLPFSKTEELVRKSFANLSTTCTPENDASVGLGQKMATVKGKDYVPPYSNDVLGSLCKIRTLENMQMITLRWQIPPQQSRWHEKSADYLSNLIGNEGPKSLISHLKTEGLIENLSGGEADSFSMFSSFEVDIELTAKGATKIPHILSAVHNYLALLKAEEWRWKEMKQISLMAFDYKGKESPEDYTSSVASLMRKYDTEDVLFAGSDYRSYNKTAISDLISMLNPENLILIHSAPHKDATAKFQVDKNYGTEYSVEKLPHEYKAAIRGANSLDIHFDLPEVNEFIVTETKVKAIAPQQKAIFNQYKDPAALLIHNDYETPSGSERTLCWWTQDTFSRPHTSLTFSLYKDSVYSCKDMVTAQLFAALATDALAEETDCATSAGYQYSISATSNGIRVGIAGFSQHINKFADLVLKKLAEPSKLLKANRFNAIQTSSKINVENKLLSDPYKLMPSLLSKALDKPIYSSHEILSALRETKFQDVQSFAQTHLRNVVMEAFVFGNADLSDAHMLFSKSKSILKTEAQGSLLHSLPPARMLTTAKLPAGEMRKFRAPPTDLQNPNSCTRVYWQYGEKKSDIEKLYLAAVSAMAHEPCYDTLRTKEQLGYIVSSNSDVRGDVLGFSILVQSPTKPAKFLHERIIHFVSTELDPMVRNYSKKSFENLKKMLSSELMEPPQDSSSIKSMAFAQVAERKYDFGLRSKRIAQIEEMSLDGFKQFYFQLRKGGGISVQLDPTVPAEVLAGTPSKGVKESQLVTNEDLVTELGSWREELESYDMVQPNKLPKSCCHQ